MVFRLTSTKDFFLSRLALTGLILSPLFAPSQGFAFTNPFFNPTPAYTTTCPSPDNCLTYNNTSTASYGFFFDVTQDVTVDGLGFSSQPGWSDGTSVYQVYLGKYLGNTYENLGIATFVPASIGGDPYSFNSGYFWQPLEAPLTLTESISDPEVGYYLTTVGDFQRLEGNVGAELVTTFQFNPLVVYDGNGFNTLLDPPFPAPVDLATDADDIPYTNGFFNANVSLVAGQAPEVPVLPPPPDPEVPDAPWVFPPVVITNPNDFFWFDPLVSIGYIYNVTSGPKIEGFIAPILPFNNTYDMYGLNAGASCSSSNPDDFTVSLGTAQGNSPNPPYSVFNFASPVDCFAVKGISAQNNLDPANTLAFLAGIKFNQAGVVSLTQTPIAVPGPLSVVGVGMAYGWTTRLRKRIKAARA